MSLEDPPASFRSRQKYRNKSAKKAQKRNLPQLNESPKRTAYIYGKKASSLGKRVQNFFHKIQSNRMLNRFCVTKKSSCTFEKMCSLESTSLRNGCSLLCLANHSKKRPHNLLLGRYFDSKILDLIELGILTFHEGENSLASRSQGHKPFILFCGASFEHPVLDRVRNLLLDFFGGQCVKKLNLAGLDSSLVVHVGASAKNANFNLPEPQDELFTFPSKSVILTLLHSPFSHSYQKISSSSNMETWLQVEVHRMRLTNYPTFSKACLQPRKTKSLPKGVSIDKLGDMRGQIHVGQQDVDTIPTRRFLRSKKKTYSTHQTGNEKTNLQNALMLKIGKTLSIKKRPSAVPDLPVDI